MSHSRSSNARYRTFASDYRARRLDLAGEQKKTTDAPDKRGAYIHEYLRWLHPHRYAVGALFVLCLLGAGLQVIEPLFMRFIVDKVLIASRLDWATRLRRLELAGTLFLLQVLLSNFVGAFREYQQRLVYTRVTLSLRRSIYERMLRLPLPRLWDLKTGGILSRLTGDVDSTTSLLQIAVISPAASAIRVVIGIFILMALNWQLALAALAIVPGVVLTGLTIARRIRPIYRSLRKDAEQIDGRVGETFSGIRVVRAFRRETHELLDYMRGRHTILRKEMFANRRETLIWATWSVLLGAVNVVVVWYGGYLNLQGRASIGDIMAFQWYTLQLLNPMWSIVNSFSELQRVLAAIERMFEVLSWERDKPDRPDAIDAPAEAREIRFQDVEFEYREGRPVIRDFNVTVPGGSVVALVGRSGAGKTTITDLAARFHDPTRGRILLNNIDIRDLRLASYRSLLALVQQDTFLFDGSVADNIAYGRHGATPEEIEDAARRANAHGFIVKLPEQYDTFIGERGVKLSGGQQQRLAIARAILAAPRILILDEATSNLDTESEQLIQAAMADLLAGRTTFVIAHRLSTVRRADLILLMEEGRIVERGKHAELMEARGMYYEMVMRQAELHEDAVAEQIESEIGGRLEETVQAD